MGMLEVRVLGRPAVARGGDEASVSGVRAGAALAVLALRAGEDVPAGVLVDALWGDEPPAGAPNALQAVVSRLRRTTGPNAIVGTPGGYRLVVERDAVDALAFADAVASGAAARRAGDAERAAKLLGDALVLWRGPLLGGVDVAGSLAPEAVRLSELREVALEERLEARLQLGDHEAAIAEAEALVADQPLREGRWAQLVRAQYRAGRQADALRTYQRLRDLLREELGIEPSPALAELERQVLVQDPELSAPAVRRSGTETADRGAGRPTSVPRPERLLGRDDELARVAAALAESRIVVIHGPGGVGKSSLAHAVASSLPAGIAPDGAFVADLAGTSHLATAREAVAAATSAAMPGATGAPTNDVLARLADSDALVVLDSFEAVGSAGGELLAELARAGSRTRLLVTSRVRVHPPDGVRAEHLALSGLPPDAAIELLRARAGEAGPCASPPADGDLAEIAAALDGLPLALELAATHLPFLPARSLLRRLADRAATLAAASGRSAALPQRHTSLDAVIAESEARLTPDAAALLRRTSVFPGSFTADAADAVHSDMGSGTGPSAAEAVPASMPALVELVDHSLVAIVAGPRGPRYRLLDTVRSHAADRLREAGEAEAARSALGRWVGSWAETLDLDGPDERASLQAADDERAVCDLAAVVADDVDRARIVLALWPWWSVRGRVEDGVAWISAVLDGSAIDALGRPAARGWAHFARGQLRERQGDADGSRADMDAAIAEARAAGDDELAARALATAAFVSITEGKIEPARALVEEAVTHGDRSPSPVGALAAANAAAFLAYATGRRREAAARRAAAAHAAGQAGLAARRVSLLGNLGVALHAAGDADRSLAVLEQVEALAREVGDDLLAVQSSANMLGALRSLGRDDEARSRAERAAADAEALGDHRTCGRALAQLAQLQLEQGDRLGAQTSAFRLAECARRHGWPMDRALGLRMQAQVALAYGQASKAVPLLEASLGLLVGESIADNRAHTLTLLGEAHLAAGSPDAALRVLGEARSVIEAVDDEPLDHVDQLIARAKAAERGAAAVAASAPLSLEPA